ncbi:sensor histidine kinase, partial [Vibrio vulnificus]|nr:sensor histidine kinase [Vibrio vulnificus]
MSLVSRWSGYRFFLFMLLLGGIGLTVTHFAASHYQQNKWASILKNYADRANQQLSSELAKFEQIPNLLSHDPRLLTYLTQPESNGLNQLLAEWSKQTLADTIYLHNQQGVVIGSSNYQQDDTFVGEDFSFRPYFIEAMQGHIARYVALGIRSNKRGYFYSAPIWLENKIAGVITVKVSLEELENSLAPERADIMVLDQNNVVFLSNQATWRYTALAPIAPEHI